MPFHYKLYVFSNHIFICSSIIFDIIFTFESFLAHQACGHVSSYHPVASIIIKFSYLNLGNHYAKLYQTLLVPFQNISDNPTWLQKGYWLWVIKATFNTISVIFLAISFFLVEETKQTKICHKSLNLLSDNDIVSTP